MKFVCPKCGLPLEICDTGAAKCQNNHSYDRSREGYYNLLLGASGGTHGDSREMLLARRRFLEKDYYKPLAHELARVISGYAGASRGILDMGCGEGYYTDYIKKYFPESSVYAFDISKEAVRLAAKRNKEIKYAVASSYKVPVADESFGTVYNIFSPLALDEVRRILMPNGAFVIAIPDREHLFSLKEAVYDEPYRNELQSEDIDGFYHARRKKLYYNVTLTGEEARDLFMMTPYAHRTSKREMARLDGIKEIDVGFRFIVSAYIKRT